MSATPIVASADDVPAAIQYAQSKIHSRWYVARRAAALGMAELVPAEWGVGLTAAGNWDPNVHPRDKDGKFIEIGALLRLFPGHPNMFEGTAVGNQDGRVQVKVTTPMKGKGTGARLGDTVSVDPANIEVAPAHKATTTPTPGVPRNKNGLPAAEAADLHQAEATSTGQPVKGEGVWQNTLFHPSGVETSLRQNGEVRARTNDGVQTHDRPATPEEAAVHGQHFDTSSQARTDAQAQGRANQQTFAEQSGLATPSGNGYSGVITRGDGTPVTDAAELEAASKALGVTNSGSDGINPLFDLSPADESQLKLDGFLTKDAGGYHLDVDAGELSADNAPDTSGDYGDTSQGIDGESTVGPDVVEPSIPDAIPDAEAAHVRIPGTDRLDMTADANSLHSLADQLQDDNPDGADQLEERARALDTAISGGYADEIAQAYDLAASDLQSMTDPEAVPGDPTSDVQDLAELFTNRANEIHSQYSTLAEPDVPGSDFTHAANDTSGVGDFTHGTPGASTSLGQNSVAVDDALARAQGMEPPADYQGPDWEMDLQGIDDSLAAGHLDDAEAAAWAMGLDNLAQAIQDEAKSAPAVTPDAAPVESPSMPEPPSAPPVDYSSEGPPDFQHVTYDPNSGTTLDVRPNLEDYTSPDWMDGSTHQLDTLENMLADGVDPTDEFAAGDYNSRDMQALQDLTNTAEALDADPSDYLNTVREIHNLGSSQQDQLMSIANGEPLEDQNSNALSNIADVLESSGVDDFREAAAGIREYLDATSSGNLPDYHANNEERANAADEVLKANGATRVWSAATDAFPGDEGGAVKYAEDVAGLLTEADNQDLPDDAKKALKDWVVNASVENPQGVGNGLVSKAFLQLVNERHNEAGPFTANNPASAREAARADQFNADGSTHYESSMISDPREPNFGRHSVKRLSSSSKDSSHHGLFPDKATADAHANENNRLTDLYNGRTEDISGATDDDLRAQYDELKAKLGNTPVYSDGRPEEGDDPVRMRGIIAELHRRGIDPNAPSPQDAQAERIAKDYQSRGGDPSAMSDAQLADRIEGYQAIDRNIGLDGKPNPGGSALTPTDQRYYNDLKAEQAKRATPAPNSDAANATDLNRAGRGNRPFGHPDAAKAHASLLKSAANKGGATPEGGGIGPQSIDDIFNEPDHQTAQKKLAAVSTKLALGGKQRKAHREALTKHHGLELTPREDQVSASTAAQATADTLSPDNPLKDRLAEKAAAPTTMAQDRPDVATPKERFNPATWQTTEERKAAEAATGGPTPDELAAADKAVAGQIPGQSSTYYGPETGKENQNTQSFHHHRAGRHHTLAYNAKQAGDTRTEAAHRQRIKEHTDQARALADAAAAKRANKAPTQRAAGVTPGSMTASQKKAFQEVFGDDPTARMHNASQAQFDDPEMALAALNNHISARRGAPDRSVAHHSLRRKLEAIQPKADAAPAPSPTSVDRTVEAQQPGGVLGIPVGDLTDGEVDFQLAGLLRQQRSGKLSPAMVDRIAQLQAERASRGRTKGRSPLSGRQLPAPPAAAPAAPAVDGKQALADIESAFREGGNPDYDLNQAWNDPSRQRGILDDLADPRSRNVTIKPPSGFETGLSKQQVYDGLRELGYNPPAPVPYGSDQARLNTRPLGNPDVDRDAAALENENYHAEMEAAIDNPTNADVQAAAHRLAELVRGGKGLPEDYYTILDRYTGGQGTYGQHDKVLQAMEEYGRTLTGGSPRG